MRIRAGFSIAELNFNQSREAPCQRPKNVWPSRVEYKSCRYAWVYRTGQGGSYAAYAVFSTVSLGKERSLCIYFIQRRVEALFFLLNRAYYRRLITRRGSGYSQSKCQNTAVKLVSPPHLPYPPPPICTAPQRMSHHPAAASWVLNSVYVHTHTHTHTHCLARLVLVLMFERTADGHMSLVYGIAQCVLGCSRVGIAVQILDGQYRYKYQSPI